MKLSGIEHVSPEELSKAFVRAENATLRLLRLAQRQPIDDQTARRQVFSLLARFSRDLLIALHQSAASIARVGPTTPPTENAATSDFVLGVLNTLKDCCCCADQIGLHPPAAGSVAKTRRTMLVKRTGLETKEAGCESVNASRLSLVADTGTKSRVLRASVIDMEALAKRAKFVSLRHQDESFDLRKERRRESVALALRPLGPRMRHEVAELGIVAINYVKETRSTRDLGRKCRSEKRIMRGGRLVSEKCHDRLIIGRSFATLASGVI